MSDIVIAGYLGFANSGDEALLSIVLSEIERRLPGRTVTVLSMRPRKTAARYGVRARHRYNIIGMMREFRRSEVFLFGGGSLIQDATSRRSLRYYLLLLRLAKRCGMKTMLFANGIGPLVRESSRSDTASVLSDVDVITLRDPDSAALLESIGVTSPVVTVTADTAFLLGDSAVGDKRRVRQTGIPEGEKYAVISIRPHNAMGGVSLTEFIGCVRDFCRHLTKAHGIVPLLVPMQRRDMRMIRQIADGADVPVYIWDAPFSEADAAAVLGGAELTLGMRLHMLIFSAVAGTPMVGISYDPKVDSLCRSMGVPSVDVDVDAMTLCRVVDDVLGRREEISAHVRDEAERMASRAALNAEILAELFRKQC